MNKYIYTDNKTKTIVFECMAINLMEADKLIKLYKNVDIIKSPHICCETVKPKN